MARKCFYIKNFDSKQTTKVLAERRKNMMQTEIQLWNWEKFIIKMKWMTATEREKPIKVKIQSQLKVREKLAIMRMQSRWVKCAQNNLLWRIS